MFSPVDSRLCWVSVCRLSRLWLFQIAAAGAAALHHLQKSLPLSAFEYVRDQVVESLPSSHELLHMDQKM